MTAHGHETVAHKRARLLRYFDERDDLPRLQRDQIISRVLSASDQSISDDAPCVGKHWFVMSAMSGRNQCPYCPWTLTLRTSMTEADLATARIWFHGRDTQETTP